MKACRMSEGDYQALELGKYSYKKITICAGFDSETRNIALYDPGTLRVMFSDTIPSNTEVLDFNTFLHSFRGSNTAETFGY